MLQHIGAAMSNWFFPLRAFVFGSLVSTCLHGLAVTVSPSSATIQENASQQFTASTPSTWAANCGSVSSAGLFKAPLYPSTTCTITANAKDGSGTVTARATVVSPIIMTPISAKTPQGQTQQFTASMSVTWVAKCGAISSSGVYTANGPVGTSCTIEGISTGSPKYTVYGYDIIGAPVSSTLTISPLNPAVTEGATQQFTTSSGATYASSCGAISTSGLFTAPLTQTSCTITAQATNGSGQSASTSAIISSPLIITPVAATTPQGQTQQFTANSTATWTASCGSINSAGLFTASAAQNSVCIITATAANGTAYTSIASDTVGAITSFTISPLNPTLTEGATQQFTTSSGATYASSCGAISTSGLFTAPLTPTSCTITAQATDGSGRVASTNAVISSPLIITPTAATTPQGQTQQFTANSPVTWSASCGSISSVGLFTASAAPAAVCTITATAVSGTAYTSIASDTIGAITSFTISPLNPAVTEGATQQFTTSSGATYASSCGTISTSGLFTAPLTQNSCSITAQATDGSGQVVSTSATISSPLVIAPTATTTPQGQTQQFTGSSAVTWTASCGSISSVGLFTASAAPTTVCTITATATSGTAYTSIASDTIGSPPSAAITSDFASPPTSNSAISTNLLGVGAGGGMHANVLNYLTQASLNYTRFHANIEYTYRNGTTPDWSMIDAKLIFARNANLQVILEMDYTPPSLQPVPNPCPANVDPMHAYPTDVDAIAAMAAAYVQHIDQQFPGLVTDYEIWNEPDGGGLCAVPNTYAGKLTQYLNIFAAMAPAIRQAAIADGVTVRIGGPTLGSPIYSADTWLPALLNNPQLAPYFDFVSFHFYVAGTPQVNQGMTWSGGPGIPSLRALTQTGSISLPPLYAKVTSLVRKGLQSNPLSTPIYVDEYNSDWTFLLDCCRNSPIYAPLWNTMFFVDLLNVAANKNVQVPSKFLYYAANNPPFCIAAPWDAAMDCKNAGATTATPYPQYYSFQLLEAPQYLGLVSGGSMVPSTSSSGDLLTAAFMSGTSDELVIVNTSENDYPAVSISIARDCSGATGGTEFLLNSSNQQIATESVNLDCSNGGYATSIYVPGLSVVALKVAQ
jgi:Glycosyl hydrolases family 39